MSRAGALRLNRNRWAQSGMTLRLRPEQASLLRATMQQPPAKQRTQEMPSWVLMVLVPGGAPRLSLL